MIPHMIPDHNHIPEVNFSYRQPTRQLPVCQIDLPASVEDDVSDGMEELSTTITSTPAEEPSHDNY